MYREPKSAKRLYFDVIPRHVDDYQQFLDGYERQDGKQRLANPVWHIHSGKPPKADMPISFNMLLTLVSSSNAENAETLWGFIGRYRPGVTPQTHPKLDDAGRLRASTISATSCCRQKKFREPSEGERKALLDLRDALSNLPPDATRRRRSRTWSMRSAAASRSSTRRRRPRTASPASRSTGSTCSTRCCSARRKARASARSSRSMGCKNTVDMIDGALARSA